MQGCHLSSVLFLLVIDSLLWELSAALIAMRLGRVFACANDIAISLNNLRTIGKVYTVVYCGCFLLCRALLCIIVLGSVCALPIVCNNVRKLLHDHVHSWRGFSICN